MKKLATVVAVAVSLVSFGSLGSLTGCAVESEEPSGSSSARIIGGQSDNAHPSVAFMRTVTRVGLDGRPASVASCTATLIGPTAMVTAAHCGGGPRMWTDVSFDAVPDMGAGHGAPGWIDAGIIAHPQYDGDPSHGHDIAVVLLAARPQRPLVPLAAPPPVGSTVTAVGYGMSVHGNDGSGVGQRRAVDMPLLGIGAHELVAGRDGQGTCHGDSGGPLFAGGALVGTTSYGDTVDCHDSNHFMRVDDNLAFLRLYSPSL